MTLKRNHIFNILIIWLICFSYNLFISFSNVMRPLHVFLPVKSEWANVINQRQNMMALEVNLKYAPVVRSDLDTKKILDVIKFDALFRYIHSFYLRNMFFMERTDLILSSPVTLSLNIYSDFYLNENAIDRKAYYDPLTRLLVWFFKSDNKPQPSLPSLYLDLGKFYVLDQYKDSGQGPIFHIYDPLMPSVFAPTYLPSFKSYQDNVDHVLTFINDFKSFKGFEFIFPKLSFGIYNGSSFKVTSQSALKNSQSLAAYSSLNGGLRNLEEFNNWDYLTFTLSTTAMVDVSIQFYYDDSCVTTYQQAVLVRGLQPQKNRRFVFNRNEVLRQANPNCKVIEYTVIVSAKEKQQVSLSNVGYIRKLKNLSTHYLEGL